MEHSHVYLLLFCCFFWRESLCGTSLTIDTCGFSGESVSLSCTLPSTEFTQPIAWGNDIIVGDISTCTPSGCGPPANSRYSASADANGIYMTITTLTRADDETTWKCTLFGQPASTVNLVVKDHPTTCAISKNSDGSFKCETDCGYPTSDLTIDWFLNTTSAVVDLSNPSIAIDTTSTPVCSNGGKASATLLASNINEDGDLYCKCGMQTACPQKALIVSGSEAVTASSSSICDSCTTTYVLAALGIVFAVVCIVFCWMVYLQRSGKFQGPCSVFTKSKCSVKQTLIAAIIATSLCVIGIILCIVGLVTLIVALAVVGFVLPVFTHVIVIILLTFFCCGKIMEKDGGNPEHTETTQVNSKNVTDDEKYVKKGETTDGKKATEVETKGSDKNDKVDKKGEKTNVIKATALEMKGIDKNDKVDDV